MDFLEFLILGFVSDEIENERERQQDLHELRDRVDELENELDSLKRDREADIY